MFSLGKQGGVAFLRSWGLVEGVKGKNEEVKEEYPSDEDGDLGIHDNLDDLGRVVTLEKYHMQKRTKTTTGVKMWRRKKKVTEENLADDTDWKSEKVFEYGFQQYC